MTKGNKRVKVGDIFAIPINEKCHSYGQIITKGFGSDCYITFDIISENHHPDIEKIKSAPILFLVFTTHRAITEGVWIVIGNSSIPQGIQISEFKVKMTENGVGKWMVQRYDGTILRQATPKEIELLDYMNSYTPNVLDDAVKAKYGIIPWKPYYDKLLYKPLKDSDISLN